MKRLLTGLAAMLVTGAAAGQILECVDAKGKKEYAQTCPPGTIKETKLMKSGAGAASPGAAVPAGKSLAEREVEFRKRNAERQEAEAKAAKEQADAKDAQRNCDDARAQLKQLQDGRRIARADPNTGERSFLEDKDRPAEIERAQQGVDNWCKK
ncbi:MAG: DUF4124 domain-containing protein [Betaproteobacteria bacterium]|nr:DUF4124 domain-containing protein [Betaproteobacteria bacterium]